MTEEQVYRQLLKNLKPTTWGQMSWTWPDGTPKCLDGHIHHILFGKCQLGSLDHVESPEEMRMVTRIHERAWALLDTSIVNFNDRRANNVNDVRGLVKRLLDQVASNDTVLIEEPRTHWWQRRKHSAHRFNLLR